jgi:hypothetical protein
MTTKSVMAEMEAIELHAGKSGKLKLDLPITERCHIPLVRQCIPGLERCF